MRAPATAGILLPFRTEQTRARASHPDVSTAPARGWRRVGVADTHGTARFSPGRSGTASSDVTISSVLDPYRTGARGQSVLLRRTGDGVRL